MNILEKIVEVKRKEVAAKKAKLPLGYLKQQPFWSRKTVSLIKRLAADDTTGIIAEFKRKSPSKGVINSTSGVDEVVADYARYGAAAISVLTDETFFGGSTNDLILARKTTSIPILRKEFIIDEYQIYEAKAFGADVILLIAACLTKAEVQILSRVAVELGLEVLLEIHDEDELQHICEETKLIGINNRSLKTFDVDIERSLRMAEKIPAGKIRIAESGISSAEDIRLFRKNNYKGFLIGETFMKEENPGEAFRKFANELKPEEINEN
jgi:indole-3-glycerol phosphate synthase